MYAVILFLSQLLTSSINVIFRTIYLETFRNTNSVKNTEKK